MSGKFVTIRSQTIYKGHIVSLRVDEILSPAGNMLEREVVEHLDAVGIIALTDDRQVVLVKQYRHAIGSDLLEIPAGLLDRSEEPDMCAIRELKEETGFTAKNIYKIAEFYTSAGFTDEKFYLFAADNIIPGKPELEFGEEDLRVEMIPLDELVNMVIRGEIQDSKTITAIMTYEVMHGRTR